ncbi:MAG: TrmH family RNA methyltransferase [Clostridia bacterium]
MSNWRDLTEEQRRQKFIDIYSDKSYPAGKSHEAVRLARDLSKNTNKSDFDHFKVLIEGLPIIEMAAKYNIDLEYLFICPEVIYSEEILSLLPKLISMSENTLDVSPKVFDLITKKGNSNGLAAIGRVSKKDLSDLTLSEDLIIILDGLETPGNIGSIIRSADAVNARGIVFTNRQAHLYHPLMIRSSRGACFKLPLIESSIEEAQKFFLDNNYEIVLANPAANKHYYQYKYNQPTALVMGSERFGISDKWFNNKYTAVSIPMLGDCDSLNVSIATTVLLYEIRLQKDKEIQR